MEGLGGANEMVGSLARDSTLDSFHVYKHNPFTYFICHLKYQQKSKHPEIIQKILQYGNPRTKAYIKKKKSMVKEMTQVAEV